MLTYPWKCTVLHCNHLGNTWKPLVLMTWHFDYCPSASEGDNQSVRSSAPVVSRCFPGGYNVKLYISRGRLAWWSLAFLHSVEMSELNDVKFQTTTTTTSRYSLWVWLLLFYRVSRVKTCCFTDIGSPQYFSLISSKDWSPLHFHYATYSITWPGIMQMWMCRCNWAKCSNNPQKCKCNWGNITACKIRVICREKKKTKIQIEVMKMVYI